MMLAQTYASLPALLQACANALMALLCAIVIVGAICRVGAMQAGKTHRWAWALMYVCYGAAAGHVLKHLATQPTPLPDAAALAITALAANVWLTRKSWPKGRPPKITEK